MLFGQSCLNGTWLLLVFSSTGIAQAGSPRSPAENHVAKEASTIVGYIEYGVFRFVVTYRMKRARQTARTMKLGGGPPSPVIIPGIEAINPLKGSYRDRSIGR